MDIVVNVVVVLCVVIVIENYKFFMFVDGCFGNNGYEVGSRCGGRFFYFSIFVCICWVEVV